MPPWTSRDNRGLGTAVHRDGKDGAVKDRSVTCVFLSAGNSASFRRGYAPGSTPGGCATDSVAHQGAPYTVQSIAVFLKSTKSTKGKQDAEDGISAAIGALHLN